MISGDALTDIDLGAFAARHRAAGGIATLAVKEVADTREYGVVLHDRDGRITGFQEKPAPEEALSRLGNCGIYIFEPRDLRLLPRRDFVDWAQDVFPTLLENDVPFYVHEIHDYWNDVGSLAELRQGTFDALAGELHLALDAARAGAPGCLAAGGSQLPRRRRARGSGLDRPRRRDRLRRAADGAGGPRPRRQRRRRRAAALEHRAAGHRAARRARSRSTRSSATRGSCRACGARRPGAGARPRAARAEPA